MMTVMRNYAWIGIYFSICLLLASIASAEILLQAHGYYSSDSLTESAATSSSRMASGADASVQIGKSNFFVGFIFNYVSDVTTANYSGQDYGLFVHCFIDKKQIYSVSGGYMFSASGLYETAGVQKQWTGVSYLGRLSVNIKINKKFSIGPSLNYYLANYDHESQGATQSNISYSKSFVYPSLALSYSF